MASTLAQIANEIANPPWRRRVELNSKHSFALLVSCVVTIKSGTALAGNTINQAPQLAVLLRRAGFDACIARSVMSQGIQFDLTESISANLFCGQSKRRASEGRIGAKSFRVGEILAVRLKHILQSTPRNLLGITGDAVAG